MGQQEITQFLKENKNTKFTAIQLSERLGISISSVTVSLKKLRHRNEVKYTKEERWCKPYYYYL